VLLSSLCSDIDFSLEFARLGGHTATKRIARSSVHEICELAHEIIASVISSGMGFPAAAGLDSTETVAKNLPHKFSYRTEGDSICDIYLRSIPGTMHGVGQEAVGGILWPSAVVLSNYLIKEAHLVRGKSVVEIGAGVGLAGLVAASLGAHSVVLSDGYDKMLENLQTNIELNTGDIAVDGRRPAVPESSSMSVQSLDWSALGDQVNSIETRSLKFPSMCPFDESFRGIDLLIGSDLICCKEDALGVAKLISMFFAYSKSAEAEVVLVIGTELNRL
jgi:predicted nicotinamide N-methyase